MFPLMVMQRQADGNMWPKYINVHGGSDSLLDKKMYNWKTPNVLSYCANDHKQIKSLLYYVDRLMTSQHKAKSPTLLSRFSPKTKAVTPPPMTAADRSAMVELNRSLLTLLRMTETHVCAACAVLQPAVTVYVKERDGGPKWAAAIGKEFGQITALVREVRRSGNDMKTWKKFYSAVEKHVNECENITLDWLYRMTNLETLEQLGRQYLIKREDAMQPSSPTRMTEASVTRMDDDFELH